MNTQAANDIAAAAQTLCYHCGLPVTDNARYTLVVDDVPRALCCPACREVAATIIDSGLGNYYRFRDNTGTRPVLAGEFAHFDQLDFSERWLTKITDAAHNDLVQCELSIGGMHCAACVWLLERHLTQLPGVVSAQIDFDAQRASVRWHRNEQPLSAICARIAAIGYQPQPYSRVHSEQLQQREQQRALRRLGVAGIGMMQVGMLALPLYGALDAIEPLYRNLLRWSSLIVAAPVLFYSGLPFLSGAWRGLRARQPGMDLPVALALLLAFAASCWATLQDRGDVYFDSVTMFIFLLSGSRYLEMRARHFRNSFSSDFFSLLPSVVIALGDDGRQSSIPLEQLQSGAIVLVRSGEVLPADGFLQNEYAHINEAALTGEYMPVGKRSGDKLLAGSINGEQALTMRVAAVGAQTRIAAIDAVTRQAQQWKPRLAQLADRLAGRFVLAIVALAALAYIGWHFIDAQRALWITLSVLVVSCPCALSLATPLALTSATNTLRRHGLLVTRADAWEQLPRITDVVFDKTGTLSEGRISIAAIEPYGTRSAAICSDIAAALEMGSSHPIAAAFGGRHVSAATDCRQFNFQQQDGGALGSGVEGNVGGRRYRLGNPAFALQLCAKNFSAKTIDAPRSGHWILLADHSGPVCWFQLQDRLRNDAAATLAALRKRGLQLHLLSGDSSSNAAEMAVRLNLEHVISGASPERKLQYVQNLQRAGKCVLMVGDGINDIPVLAAADVSVAMQGASQLAKSNADCLLLGERLDRLPLLLDVGAKTHRIVRENLWWALLYNAVAIPLAALGWVTPWLAAIGMSLSSLLVTLNAQRLQFGFKRRSQSRTGI